MGVRETSLAFPAASFLLLLGSVGQAQTLIELRGVRGEHVGSTVGEAGDFDQDGFPDLLVGGDQTYLPDTRPAFTAGAVGILSGRDGSLLFRVTGEDYLALTGRTEVTFFGVKAAVVGDLDLDGTSDVLVVHGSAKYIRWIAAFSGATGGFLFELTDPYGGLTNFGSPVVALGDVLDTAGGPFPDGFPDFAVGAPLNPVSTAVPTYPGRVYLYSGAAPTSGPVITLSGSFPRIAFGHDLAVVGDLDGDGLPALAVSAVSGSGVEVFDGPGFTSTVFLSSPFVASALFGYSLAHLGDLNGDGWSELGVGAPGARQAEGSVVVYSLEPSNPVEVVRLQAAGAVSGTEFGYGIAGLPMDPLTGRGLLDLDHDGQSDPFLDWNRDGLPDFLVSAPALDSALTNVGAIFVVPGTGATLEQAEHPLQQGPVGPSSYAYFPGLAPRAGDVFGQGLVLLGNAAGESQVRLGVGSPNDERRAGLAALLRLPFAHFDDDTFSRASDGVGSQRTLRLDFGPRYANRRFVLLGTTGGGNPGQVAQGLTLPLNDDGPGGLWERTTSLQADGFPLRFSQLTGFLDGAGRAQVTLEVTAPVAGHPWFEVPEHLYLPVVMQANRPSRLGLIGAPTPLRIQ